MVSDFANSLPRRWGLGTRAKLARECTTSVQEEGLDPRPWEHVLQHNILIQLVPQILAMGKHLCAFFSCRCIETNINPPEQGLKTGDTSIDADINNAFSILGVGSKLVRVLTSTKLARMDGCPLEYYSTLSLTLKISMGIYIEF